MNDKVVMILLIAMLLCIALFEYAIWSVQTGIPIGDIILFRA